MEEYIGISVRCEVTGVIKLNGVIAGEGSAYYRCLRGSRVVVEWLPLVGGFMPLCAAFSPFETPEASHGCRIEECGSECTLILAPERILAVPKLIPHIVLQKGYDMGGQKYTVSAYYDGGYIISVEHGGEGRIIFARYMDFSLAKAVCDMSFFGSAWYICISSEGNIAVLEHKSAVSIVFGGKGSCELSEGEMRLFAETDDRAGRKKITRFSSGSSIYSKMDVSLLKTKEDTVFAFLFSVRHGITEDAAFFLSRTLMGRVSVADLKEFFGDFTAVRPPALAPNLPENTVCAAVLKPKGKNVFSAKLYYFDFEQGGKIANIRE